MFQAFPIRSPRQVFNNANSRDFGGKSVLQHSRNRATNHSNAHNPFAVVHGYAK